MEKFKSSLQVFLSSCFDNKDVEIEEVVGGIILNEKIFVLEAEMSYIYNRAQRDKDEGEVQLRQLSENLRTN